jgi:hypothetical protein
LSVRCFFSMCPPRFQTFSELCSRLVALYCLLRSLPACLMATLFPVPSRIEASIVSWSTKVFFTSYSHTEMSPASKPPVRKASQQDSPRSRANWAVQRNSRSWRTGKGASLRLSRPWAGYSLSVLPNRDIGASPHRLSRTHCECGRQRLC